MRWRPAGGAYSDRFAAWKSKPPKDGGGVFSPEKVGREGGQAVSTLRIKRARDQDAGPDKVAKSLDDNLAFLKERLGVGESFDVLYRVIEFAGKRAAFFYVNNLVPQTQMTLLMHYWETLAREDLSVDTLHKFIHRHADAIQVSTTDAMEKVVTSILAGPAVLFLDGVDQAVILDVRSYPVRSIEEPALEKVERGSRDGFVETMSFNAVLIRRRLRDPNLRMEAVQVGRRSQTDVVVSYIKDIANPELVQAVKDRIKDIDIDGLPMAERALAEMLGLKNPWNPFPRVRFTERPDVAVIHLLEGHVLVLVDTTASVLIAPSTLWHHLQHAEEYHTNPLVGTYIRWVRYIAVFASVFLMPVWLLFALEPGLLPPVLKFIGPSHPGKIPLLAQFVIAEIAVDMIRQATLHIDTALSTAVGIVAAVVVGQYAAQIGLLDPEVIIYTAVAAVGTFLTPSFELSMANRLVRLLLLLLTGIWRLPGLIVGTAAFFLLLVTSRSFGVPYLWPLIPFSWPALKAVLLRSPVPVSNIRPEALHPRDATRRAVPEPARKPRREERR